MKKAQMEMLGLAIFVVLLVLGFAFVAKLWLLKNPVEHRQSFIRSQLSSNMINTLIKTSTTCSQLSMTELLQDCAQAKSISCGSKSSCEFVKDTSKEIFGKSLDKWKMTYKFLAYTDINSPRTSSIINLGEDCKAKERDSEIFPIRISGGTLYIRLDIC